MDDLKSVSDLRQRWWRAILEEAFGMKLTARELNRATLARQLLLGREEVDVLAAVRRVVAVQAQQPPSPYLALWNRMAGFDPADLDAAFTGGEMVKANPLRMTLHAMPAQDYPATYTAMLLSLRTRFGDKRFTSTGLGRDDLDAIAPDVLAYLREPRTSAEVTDWLTARGIPAKGVWWILRYVAPLWHAPTGGPWSFGTKPSYVASGTPHATDTDGSAEALRRLVLRYLAGFGPASVADMGLFMSIYRYRVAEAVRSLSGELEVLEGPDGKPLYDLPGAPRPDPETPAPPRLLGMWDNALLAHADRDRIYPADYRKSVARANGDVLPTLLVDGYVAGVWRAVDGGIEATAFRRLSPRVWDELAAEAAALLTLLADREPQVYRRYHHWWGRHLPAAEVRVLPG